MGQCGGFRPVFYPFSRQSFTARMRAWARARAASAVETFISMPRTSRSYSARRSAASARGRSMSGAGSAVRASTVTVLAATFTVPGLTAQ